MKGKVFERVKCDNLRGSIFIYTKNIQVKGFIQPSDFSCNSKDPQPFNYPWNMPQILLKGERDNDAMKNAILTWKGWTLELVKWAEIRCNLYIYKLPRTCSIHQYFYFFSYSIFKWSKFSSRDKLWKYHQIFFAFLKFENKTLTWKWYDLISSDEGKNK